MSEPNVAVLIDYENVSVNTFASLFDQISDVGRVIVKRAYADWSRASQKSREQLQELGIEAIQNFHAKGSAKNSSDIRMAIDAVELLYISSVDTFVIVSADSDFVPLVNKLRAGGKGVIGSGREDVVSQTLVKSCDRYIFLDKAGPFAKNMDGAVLEAAQQLLLRALRASSDEEGKVVGSKLYQNMLRIDPSFDFNSLGFRNFSHFLRDSPNVKVSKPGRGRDVVVEEM